MRCGRLAPLARATTVSVAVSRLRGTLHRSHRSPDAAPTDRVIGLSPLQIQRRFTAAARAAGIAARVTAHSGRVGLASELTARGASTTEVMLAGNWKTGRMVAHLLGGRDRRTRGRPKVSVGRGLREAEHAE